MWGGVVMRRGRGVGWVVSGVLLLFHVLYVCVCARARVCVCMYVCMYGYIYVCVCMYVCMVMCVCVCVWMCVCIL